MRNTKLVLCFAACALAVACGGADKAGNSGQPANTSNSTAVAAASPTPTAQTPDAQTIVHEGAGIQFDVPTGWRTAADGEQYRLGPASGEVMVTFWVPAEGDFESAAKAIGQEVGKQLKNLKFDGEPKEDKHNGMDHVSVTGSGQAEGRNVTFSADLLQAKKPVIILTIVSPEKYKEHEADYTKFVNSIRKTG